MYCPNCGTKIECDDAQFCFNCGLRMLSPAQLEELKWKDSSDIFQKPEYKEVPVSSENSEHQKVATASASKEDADVKADANASKGESSWNPDAENYFRLGKTVEKIDTAKAFQYFRKSANLGKPEAMNKLGFCYFHHERGTSCNIDEAFAWFQKGADKGDAGCMMMLAQFYMSGTVTDQDDEIAIQWIKKAAETESEIIASIASRWVENYEVTRSAVIAVMKMALEMKEMPPQMKETDETDPLISEIADEIEAFEENIEIDILADSQIDAIQENPQINYIKIKSSCYWVLAACFVLWLVAPFAAINLLTFGDQPTALQLLMDDDLLYLGKLSQDPAFWASIGSLIGMIACLCCLCNRSLNGASTAAGLAEIPMIVELILALYYTNGELEYIIGFFGIGYWGIFILLFVESYLCRTD